VIGVGLEAVYNNLKEVLLNDAFCYYDQNVFISEESTYDIVDSIVGTDADGDFVIYEIVSTDEFGSILLDRNILLTGKYTVSFSDGAYSGFSISEHSISTSGNDLIKCYNITDIIRPGGIDEATYLSLVLVTSAYFSSEPIEIRMKPPHMKLFGGEQVSILISTKEDQDNSILESITQKVISYIMKNYRKFNIYNSSGDVVGYYKLTTLPIITQGFSDGQNIQNVKIALEGFYMRSYK
jgi:hypothetical protein